MCKIPGQTLCRRLLTIQIWDRSKHNRTNNNFKPTFIHQRDGQQNGGCVLMSPNATLCLFTEVEIHYILNNHILEQVQENQYLGVIIIENLKWSTYINKICNKANSTLGFIRRNLKHCNQKFKETAYISLVCSLFDYSSTVWDPHLQKDIDRIEGQPDSSIVTTNEPVASPQ